MSRFECRLFNRIIEDEALGSASMIWDAIAYRLPDRSAQAEQDRNNRSSASKETNSAQERDRVLNVAETLIRRIGHRKTTAADIAHDLGTSRANVYRFFPTRGAIDLAVYARIANRTLGMTRAISRREDAASIRLAAIFADLHQQALTRLTEELHVHELFVAATEGRWEVAIWYFGEITKIFEATIREGLERGELKGDDPGNAARCVMASITPFVQPNLVQQRVADGDDLKSELEAQTRFILRALGTVSG